MVNESKSSICAAWDIIIANAYQLICRNIYIKYYLHQTVYKII